MLIFPYQRCEGFEILGAGKLDLCHGGGRAEVVEISVIEKEKTWNFNVLGIFEDILLIF